MVVTTIQVSQATRERLVRMKYHPRESYDELLNKLLALIPEGDEEGSYTHAFRVGLLNARLDIREGRLVEHERVKRELGL